MPGAPDNSASQQPDKPYTRKASRFSWKAVDKNNTGLLRKILIAAYSAAGTKQDLAELKKLTEKNADGENELAAWAEFSLGRPPRPEFRSIKTNLGKALTRALQNYWIPTLSDEEIQFLCDILSGYRNFADTPARLQYLRSNPRNNFAVALWKQFVNANKEQFIIESDPPTETDLPLSGITLKGEAKKLKYDKPFPHQKVAWRKLSELWESRSTESLKSGLLLMPTGSGKTTVMVDWLLKQMEKDAKLRVLWLVHAQELVDQAVREFRDIAKTLPIGFTRQLRRIHSDAGSGSLIGDQDADIVVSTWQSVLSNTWNQNPSMAKDRLDEFLTRTTIVVVDEAHHAWRDPDESSGYTHILDYVCANKNCKLLIGMTATKREGMGSPLESKEPELHKSRYPGFPDLYEVSVGELMNQGVLARLDFLKIDTNQKIVVSEEAGEALDHGRDISTIKDIMDQINSPARNKFIVDKWLERPEYYGKTLVFAATIDHANNLFKEFKAEFEATRSPTTDIDILHSQVSKTRSAVLDRFRQAQEPSILISVGMLLEGVDVPTARTAFLCRPTRSDIVLRQSVGRVLRGPLVGGEALARVVDFVDLWEYSELDVLGILNPGDVKEYEEYTSISTVDREPDLAPISAEVLAELLTHVPPPLDNPVPDVLIGTLLETAMVGYYELPDADNSVSHKVPVFEHYEDDWHTLAKWVIHGEESSLRPDVFDAEFPRPQSEDVTAFEEYCRSHQDEPPFVPIYQIVSPQLAAETLMEKGPITKLEEYEYLKSVYESSIAPTIYPTLQSFIEVVNQKIFEINDARADDPDTPHRPEPSSAPTDTLGSVSNRDLRAIYYRVVARGIELLKAGGDDDFDEYAPRLAADKLPQVGWMAKNRKGAWAYWQWEPREPADKQNPSTIQVHQALRAPADQVSDELLESLLWHELCHHLAPGLGHNSEFRRIESYWPNYARLNAQLDTLPWKYVIPGMTDEAGKKLRKTNSDLPKSKEVAQ